MGCRKKHYNINGGKSMLIGLGDNLNLTLNVAVIIWGVVNVIRAMLTFVERMQALK